MKLLTFWNVAGLGLGLIGVSFIVDALPGSGSSPLAQSTVSSGISALVQQVSPNDGSPSTSSLSQLLRIGERTYEVNFDAGISSQVLASSVIRKIEFGSETLVSVVSTPSGTYSTDAFASPHVNYPGVSVTETTPDAGRSLSGQFAFNGQTSSFLSNYTQNGDKTVLNAGNQFCTGSASFVYCSWR